MESFCTRVDKADKKTNKEHWIIFFAFIDTIFNAVKAYKIQ